MIPENFRRVADAIETANSGQCVQLNGHAERMLFDMSSWQASHSTFTLEAGSWQEPSSCGTAACVAGFAAALKEKGARARDAHSCLTLAMSFLGLTCDEAEELFYGGPYKLEDISAKKESVPAILRAMADGMYVDWRRAVTEVGVGIEEDWRIGYLL